MFHGWNLTRFLELLGQAHYLKLLGGVFDEMVRRLDVAVADLGVHTAGNLTGLSGRQNPHDK